VGRAVIVLAGGIANLVEPAGHRAKHAVLRRWHPKSQQDEGHDLPEHAHEATSNLGAKDVKLSMNALERAMQKPKYGRGRKSEAQKSPGNFDKFPGPKWLPE
jgi:hypothetical protein